MSPMRWTRRKSPWANAYRAFVPSRAPSVSARNHPAYSSHACASRNAFSCSARGCASPQSLRRTYWRASMSSRARATPRSLTTYDATAGILGLELEPPVVAAQLVAGRVLDGARPEQGEPHLRADGVRGRVADRRERVQRAVLARRPDQGDQGGGRPGRHATPLPLGEHRP